jgi:hypothetical protein
MEDHELLAELIKRPAAFQVTLYALLWLSRLEDGRFVVSFDPDLDHGDEWVFDDADSAVRKFLELRAELQLGEDHETEGVKS